MCMTFYKNVLGDYSMYSGIFWIFNLIYGSIVKIKQNQIIKENYTCGTIQLIITF